jgi:hypothetical protein
MFLLFASPTFPRYVLVALDATIYPADAGYLDGALQIVSTVCHFGPHAIAHLQLPVPQSNTNTNALLRHTRTIEDSLHSRGIDITHKLSLHFTKPADSTGNDKRKLMQSCMACFSDGDKLLWQPPSVVGPLPLIRINEMRGYDSETRPGPTARAEQLLRFALVIRFEGVMFFCPCHVSAVNELMVRVGFNFLGRKCQERVGRP